MILIVWVDDIIIACNDPATRDRFKKHLCDLFSMKDLGEISLFLGIEFSREDDSVKMCQSQFVSRVLKRFDMENCKPRSTPCEMSPNSHGSPDESEPADSTLYRQIVGSLIYIMIATRPDLCYAVTKLSQHMSNPTVADLVVAKHVLRYLKGTTDKGLIFKKSSVPLKLKGYCDSDWGSSDDRKSVTGYCFMLSDEGPVISWKSRKQQTVALSTCEAEYMALSAATQEGKFLVQLYKDMIPDHMIESDAVQDFDLHCDNQGAMALAKNPVQHQRSKHIDIRYHYIRDEIMSGCANLLYVPTADNVADIFTKPVVKTRMNKFSLPLTGIQ